MGSLLMAQTQAFFAWHAYRTLGVNRDVLATAIGHMVHLTQEILGAAKGIQVVDGDVDRGAPTLLGIGASMPRHAGCQRFHQQRQAKALVAMAQATHWEKRAGRLLKQHPGVVGGHALGVNEDIVLVSLAGLVLAVGHAVGGDRRRDVHHHARLAAERKPQGQRVGGEHGLGATKGRHTGRIGVRAGNQHQQVVLQRPHQVHRQAGDVVAAANHQGGRTQFASARGEGVQGLVHQPGAGQTLTVPQQGSGSVGHHQRRALALHAAGFQFLRVTRQQLQAVGVVTQQVTLHQGVGHAIGLRGTHAGSLQQGAREAHQGIGPIQRGRGGHAGVSRCAGSPVMQGGVVSHARAFEP